MTFVQKLPNLILNKDKISFKYCTGKKKSSICGNQVFYFNLKIYIAPATRGVWKYHQQINLHADLCIEFYN